MFRDLEELKGTYEFQLDPLCTITCDPQFIDVETDFDLTASSVELDYWDDGFNVCGFVNLECEVVAPDYLDNDPWDLLVETGSRDPYS